MRLPQLGRDLRDAVGQRNDGERQAQLVDVVVLEENLEQLPFGGDGEGRLVRAAVEHVLVDLDSQARSEKKKKKRNKKQEEEGRKARSKKQEARRSRLSKTK